jgi:hypothetical protein
MGEAMTTLPAIPLSKEAGIQDYIGKIPDLLKKVDLKRSIMPAARNITEKGPSDAAVLVDRVFSPIRGIPEGWRQNEPMRQIKRVSERARESASALQASGKKPKFDTIGAKNPQPWNPFSKAEGGVKVLKGDELEELKAMSAHQKTVPWYDPARLLHSERGHLLEANKPLKDVIQQGGYGAAAKELAERASRSGWTGASRYTKYLPVGGKGALIGFGAAGIPGIVNAPKVTPTGEGGTFERAGGLGLGTLGWIAGTGTGLFPSVALGFGAERVGSRLGRIVDRLRSGADIRTAVGAPSPTEAQKQLATIQHYYG